MPSINISEADFTAAADGAWALMARGKRQEAEALDKIARKINAALSNQTAKRAMGTYASVRGPGMRWQDVPSTLEYFDARAER